MSTTNQFESIAIEGTTDVAEWLRGMQSIEKTPAQRMLCVTWIGEQVTKPVPQPLEEVLCQVCLHDGDPVVRHEAAFVLGLLYSLEAIEGSQALDTLCESSQNDPSIVVRHESAEALAFFPVQKAIDVLSDLVEDESHDVVTTAQIALEKIQRHLGIYEEKK
ncbi:MAG: HEAT repeat domain-containing protein [Gemmataceae bacterium]